MTNKTVKELVENLHRLEKWCYAQDRTATIRLHARQAVTTLTQQAAEIEALREALENIRETVAKRQLPITNNIWEMANTALTGGGPTDEQA